MTVVFKIYVLPINYWCLIMSCLSMYCFHRNYFIRYNLCATIRAYLKISIAYTNKTSFQNMQSIMIKVFIVGYIWVSSTYLHRPTSSIALFHEVWVKTAAASLGCESDVRNRCYETSSEIWWWDISYQRARWYWEVTLELEAQQADVARSLQPPTIGTPNLQKPISVDVNSHYYKRATCSEHAFIYPGLYAMIRFNN